MATNPLAPIIDPSAPAPVPGLFDGQIDGGLPPQPGTEEEVQVAGPLGDTVAPVFGKTLSDARKKGQILEEGGTLPGIEKPDMTTKEIDTPVEAVDPASIPDNVEIEGPLLPELSDPLRAEEITPQPGATKTPAKFVREDAYERYITVDNKAVEASLNATENRERILAGGMSDFNDKKIIDEDGIQERIELISQQYEGPIGIDKRGVQTHEETKQLADLIGMSPNKLVEAMLGRQRGRSIEMDGKGMVETMFAAKQLLVAEMRKMEALGEIARTGTDEQALAFRYQLELVANLEMQFKGSQTEIARTLNAMRMPATGVASDPAMADELAARGQRDLTAILQQYGGAGDVRMMAEMLGKTGPPHQKSALVRAIRKLSVNGRLTSNALYEVWQHSILTNPVSQAKNVIGNVMTVVMSDLVSVGAAGLGSINRSLGGKGGATWAGVNAKIFGQVMALQNAFMYAGKAFATMEPQIAGSKIDKAQSAGRKNVNALSGEAFGATGNIATALDVLGNSVTLGRIAFRSLEMGDTFFKTIAYQGKMHEDAMDAGQARGLKGDDLSSFIADFVNDPPAYAMTRAEAEAKYITLQTELDEAGLAFQKIQQLPIMRWVVPFLKTPYNSTKWAFIDHSPLGLFWGDTRRKIDAGGKDAQEALSRIAIGTSVGLTTAILTYNGLITGGGPANRSEASTDRRLGIAPYSFKIKDKYYSYAGSEPFASNMGIWSDVTQIIMSGTQDDAKIEELIAAAVAGTAHNLTNKSFMRNFATFLEAMNDPDRYSESMINSFIKSLVPRGIAHAERMVNPTVQSSRTYIEDLKAQIPGLSNSLKPRVDLWGRDQIYGMPTIDASGDMDGGSDLALGPDIVSPIFVSQFKPNIVDLEIKRMKVHPSKISDTIQPEGLKEPIQLTDDQRYWLQVRSGKLAFKMLSELIKTTEYQKLKKFSESGNKLVTEQLTNKIRGTHRIAKELATAELESGVSDSEEPGSEFDKMVNGTYNKKGELIPGLLHRIKLIMELELEQTQQELGQIQ